jgi:CRISPR-associated endonuclease Cas2
VDYLIAYDVGDPRRLRRVARLLERRAVRCQYSVFLFRGSRAAAEGLLDEAAALLRPSEDVIQAWPVGGDPGRPELVRGSARPARPAAVVLDGVLRAVRGRPATPGEP